MDRRRFARLERTCAATALVLAVAEMFSGCGARAASQPTPPCGDPLTRDVPGRGSYVLTRLRLPARPGPPTSALPPAQARDGAAPAGVR